MQESVTEERWKYLGGSDIPAVMGISPFTKRFDLLRYKAQIAEPDFMGNRYTEYGNVMEAKIRDYINAGTEEGKYVEDKVIVEKPDISWRYHSDGWNEKLDTVLEIKTTSEIHETADEYKKYLVQLLFGMYMHKAKHGLLAVYERPEEADGWFDETFDEDRLQIFYISLADYQGLQDFVLESIDAFTKDLVYLKAHKKASEAELPSMSMLADVTNEMVELDGRPFRALYFLLHEKEIKDLMSSIRSKLTKTMEERNIKSVKFDNGLSISFTPAGEDTTKTVFDTEMFAKDYPDLYEKYLRASKVKGKASHVTIRQPKH